MGRPYGRYTHCGQNPCGTMTWEEMYGTTYEGNLPQHKKHLHIGNSWIACPYSIQALKVYDAEWEAAMGFTRAEYESLYGPLDVNSKIIDMLGFVPSPLHNHTLNGKDVFMIPKKKGVWGYECQHPDCPYLLDNGRPYFYI